MFTKAQRDHIGRMRELFFRTGSSEGIVGVRSEVLAGWRQVYEMGAMPEQTYKPRVPMSKIQERIQARKELTQIASYYIEKMYEFLKGSGFFVSLIDESGYVLKDTGDSEMLEQDHAKLLRAGAYRGLSNPSFNMISAGLMLKRPFFICSTEHSSADNDDWAGASAPILVKGHLLGLIGITGFWCNANPHTLGMAVMTAEAISHQMVSDASESMLEHVAQSIDFGLAYIDADGIINYINRKGIDYLGADKGDWPCVGGELSSFLDTKVSMDQVAAGVGKRGRFECEVYTASGRAPLSCTFLAAGKSLERREKYLLYIYKSKNLGQIATRVMGAAARFTFDDIVGTSQAILRAKQMGRTAAQHPSHILILGESGTGKELFAQAIHNASDRASGPFIAINCGALPKTLIESELFGYEGGTFTGASKRGQQGKFELANGGTIFLDEIGDMPYEVQVTLLRVLQMRQVTRIGGKQPIDVDVVVIAATNQDLQAKLANKTFREDLFYRLNTFVIRIPPLRERREDIGQLARYFMGKYVKAFQKQITGISEEALRRLERYTWPGNVRELENAIERATMVSTSTQIREEDISLEAGLLGPTDTKAVSAPLTEQEERSRLTEAMERCGYNLTKAAASLGISRPTMYKKLKRFHIQRDRDG